MPFLGTDMQLPMRMDDEDSYWSGFDPGFGFTNIPWEAGEGKEKHRKNKLNVEIFFSYFSQERNQSVVKGENR